MSSLNHEPSADKHSIATRILVVDDSPTILHAICSLLEQEPTLEIIGKAEDGEQAIDAVVGLSPEVVLMDVSMPRMNGLRATKVLSERFPAIPILLMSIEDSPLLRAKCQASGAYAFIYKPRFRKQLLAVIQTIHDEANWKQESALQAALIEDGGIEEREIEERQNENQGIEDRGMGSLKVGDKGMEGPSPTAHLEHASLRAAGLSRKELHKAAFTNAAWD
ncbi:MAG TPA: response regulator transcription factor [Candidatus Angelobacter sp.]|nr:response regulator transcription factor [Candidatus Angelobacter sp.]